MASEPKIATHWAGCWKAHDDCCEAAVRFLIDGAEAIMLDALHRDPGDPNALEMQHRFKLLGIDGSSDA